MIEAKVTDDDAVVEIPFDASPWFEQATDDEILKASSVDFCGGYECDVIADYMRDKDEEVGKFFNYLEALNEIQASGFFCTIDELSAIEWLKSNRPHLAKQLEVKEC